MGLLITETVKAQVTWEVCLEKREGRQNIGVRYLLVTQLMCDGKGQIETIVFGEHTLPLSTAHAS